jgi:hypothetical protein
MTSSSHPKAQQPSEDARTVEVDAACPAQPGRSPLADARFGLAWANPAMSNEALVRNALRRGTFHMLLEAALHHGLQFVEQQLAIIQTDEDAALSSRALAEVRRKLANIARGIAEAERAAQEVPHPEAGRPSAGLGLGEGRK